MFRFRSLLVATTSLGLGAGTWLPAAATASELNGPEPAAARPTSLRSSSSGLNLAAIQQYTPAQSREQVTGISQFSDVKPTDWAYQALSNLIERYGCVAGYPDGTYKGGRAMTRFEAAALLNACLDRVTEVTDELKRLMAEFEQELAVLKGRVDGLEAKVGELEAQQFSTTTKLRGEATFDLGAFSYGGSAKDGNSGPGLKDGEQLLSAMTFNYEVKLNFDTSFTGKDLLRTRLRGGNYTDSAFNGSQYPATKLDRSFQSKAGPNVVDIDRLYYQFPVGKELTVTLGARARNTEMLAIRPSVYQSTLLELFNATYGASGVYNRETGQALGLVWKQHVKKGQPYLAAALNYVAQRANNGNPGEGGLLSENGAGSFLAQLGVASKQWALMAGYRYGQCGTTIRSGTQYTFNASKLPCSSLDSGAATNNVAVNAYWQPAESGWVPSISLGWGLTVFNDGYDVVAVDGSRLDDSRNAQSWMVGLQWKDVFVKGNSAGMAVGQAPFTTSTFSGDTPNDGNYVWEWWYNVQVSDNISITPALFYLSRPAGQNTPSGETFNAFGGVVRGTFRF